MTKKHQSEKARIAKLSKMDFSKMNTEETIKALRLMQVDIGPTNALELLGRIK